MAATEEELQTLQPPKDELHGSAFRLVVVTVYRVTIHNGKNLLLT